MRESNSGSGVLTATLIGMAIGVAVGMLYAPQSGRETRTMIKDRFNDMRERAMSMRDRWQRNAEEVCADTQRAAPEMGAEMRSTRPDTKLNPQQEDYSPL